MSQAASQAAAFYRDVANHLRVWTVRDAGGYPAPMNSSGRRAQPFWSTRTRVERIIKNAPAYADFEPVELSWEAFRDKWLPQLETDGCLVGVNWSGKTALGYDLEPARVRKCVEIEIDNLRTTGAVPPPRTARKPWPGGPNG